MRSIAVALLALAVAVPAVAEIDGASLTLFSPSLLIPGQTYTFDFVVQNASSDGEAISSIHVGFPDGFTLFESTMTVTPIVPGRPDFTMYIPPIDHTGIWEDANGGMGEIFALESTHITIDATVATVLYGTPIFFCINGDGTGAAPHQVCGCVDLVVSGVENESWSTIKAMYR